VHDWTAHTGGGRAEGAFFANPART